MRFCGCAVVRLCGCAVLRLCGYAVVRLCGCAVFRLCGFAVLRLCGYAVLRLCGFSVLRFFRLCGFSVVLFFCGSQGRLPFFSFDAVALIWFNLNFLALLYDCRQKSGLEDYLLRDVCLEEVAESPRESATWVGEYHVDWP